MVNTPPVPSLVEGCELAEGRASCTGLILSGLHRDPFRARYPSRDTAVHSRSYAVSVGSRRVVACIDRMIVGSGRPLLCQSGRYEEGHDGC